MICIMYIFIIKRHKTHTMNSEFSDSARDEIKSQLEELEKHSGKDATDIQPKPQRYVNKRITKTLRKIRERLNATILYSDTRK